MSWLGVEPSAAAVEDASAKIRALFEATPMPEALAAKITDAYESLCLRCVDVNVPTAVRSSAAGEDARGSAVRRYLRHLPRRFGCPAGALDAVRSCWGSLFTGHALAYRLRKGISHHDMPIAVGVIELIHARASGWRSLCTRSPASRTGSSSRRPGAGARRSCRAWSTPTTSRWEGRRAAAQVRRGAQVGGAIAAAVTSIENHYGYPVDVEWVISRHRRAGDPVCIVQSRPVTVTAETSAPAAYDPVALATKYVFSGKPIPGR